MMKKTVALAFVLWLIVCLPVVHAADSDAQAGPTDGTTQTISGQSIMDAAITMLNQRLDVKSAGADIVISSLTLAQDLQEPAGDVTLQASLWNGIRYNGPVVVNVTVSVNGQTVATVPVRYSIKLYKDVVVAAHLIEPLDIVKQEDLRYDHMEIDRLAPGYNTDTAKVVGLVSRRAIQPGMVVTDFMLSQPLVMKRGSTIIILVKMGGLEVSAAGQALQDGSVGQLIRVQNTVSKKIVTAKVLDASSVLVLNSY